MSLSIVLVLLTEAVFLFYSVMSSINNAKFILNTAVDNSRKELEKMDSETDQIYSLVQNSDDVQTALRNIPQDSNTTYSQKLEINGYLFTLQKNNAGYVDSFYMLLDDGRQFKSTNFPLLYDDTQDIPQYGGLRGNETLHWISAYEKSIAANNHKEGYVAAVYPLYNIRTGECVGLILEEIRTQTIGEELLASCSLENVKAEIRNENGGLLLSVGEVKDSIFAIIESSANMENGWGLVFKCSIWSLIGDTVKVALLLGMSLILVIVLCSALLSRKLADSISKPISHLLHIMENEEFNQMEDAVEIKTDIYEVNRLFRKYNQMIHRLKELFLELEQKQETIRKSEYAALQAQINPHFLYNTLDNITWKIRAGDMQDAIDEVMSLSRFFRLSLSKGAELVPIKNEIEHVQLYLKILKKRYVKRFDFEVEEYMRVSDMERFFVPKLVLQPLVENAIYHGFEQVQENGKIRITVDWKGNEIIFEVYDNGQGIEKSCLEEINEKLKNICDCSAETDQNGYGIFNINARIKNVFGMEYGLSYESKQNQYTIAKLTLPCNVNRSIGLKK